MKIKSVHHSDVAFQAARWRWRFVKRALGGALSRLAGEERLSKFSGGTVWR